MTLEEARAVIRGNRALLAVMGVSLEGHPEGRALQGRLRGPRDREVRVPHHHHRQDQETLTHPEEVAVSVQEIGRGHCRPTRG